MIPGETTSIMKTLIPSLPGLDRRREQRGSVASKFDAFFFFFGKRSRRTKRLCSFLPREPQLPS